MKLFVTKILLFTIFLVVLFFMALYISSCYVSKRDFSNGNTESNTLVIGENQTFDFVILGISHGRVMSRDLNHDKVEIICSKRFLNLAQGRGQCGFSEQEYYLKYFYRKGNSTNTLVYFITPPMFFNSNLANNSFTFVDEPFKFDFLWNYMFFESEEKPNRILEYTRSKFKDSWIQLRPLNSTENLNVLDSVDSLKIANGLKSAYPMGLDSLRFQKSIKTLEETISMAKQHGTETVFVIAPSLINVWPGQSEVEDFLEKMSHTYGTQFYNFSDAIQDPHLFYDHHHLNSRGVEIFAKDYLCGIL